MKKLRVDITEIAKNLEIVARDLVSTRLVGKYKSVFKGKGLEFEDFREYSPGDDASHIDWKASLRSDKLLVKDFTEERNLRLFLIMDVSETMLFGAASKIKSEYAAQVAASLMFLIQRAGDQGGYALFSDKVVKFNAPRMGIEQFYIFLKDVSETSNWGGGFKFKDALDYVFTILQGPAVVIIISDFIGLRKEKNWEETLKKFSKKFDTIIFMVRDPRDEVLPKEDMEITIQDPLSNKIMSINPQILARRYQNYVKKEEEELERRFTSSETDFIKLRTDQPFLTELVTLFKKRAVETKTKK